MRQQQQQQSNSVGSPDLFRLLGGDNNIVVALSLFAYKCMDVCLFVCLSHFKNFVVKFPCLSVGHIADVHILYLFFFCCLLGQIK